MKSLKENDVWNLVKLPPGRKLVGSKWVFKKKTGSDGSVKRYKARLVEIWDRLRRNILPSG